MWSVRQMVSARNEYGEIVDLPFPNIDPTCDSNEVKSLGNVYLQKILELNPRAVHIMGELTFSFYLINQLLELNIRCIASTTERIVEMEGDVKKIKFKFVRFRNY